MITKSIVPQCCPKLQSGGNIFEKFDFNNIYLNSRDDIKALQKALNVKEDGIIGKNTIRALQRMVGTKDDGIWGKNSIAATNNYLGTSNKTPDIFYELPEVSVKGKRIKKAVEETYTPWDLQNAGDSVQGNKAYYYNTDSKEWCKTNECAQWANSTLKRYVDSRGRTLYKESEIGGDAWTRLSSGENAKMVLSGYEGMDYDPNKYSERASNNRNHIAADNFMNSFAPDTLDRSKTYLVNMYYDSSPNKRLAWTKAKEGTTGTHTGNAYWNPDTSSWHVAHNVHGTIHDDELSSVLGSKNGLGYGVTALAEAPRVDYTRSDWNETHPVKRWINANIHDFGMWKEGGKLVLKHQDGDEIEPAVITAIPSNVAKSIVGKKYIDGLNDFRSQIMQDYDLTDDQYSDLMTFAVNIANQESKLGDSPRYKIKSNAPDSLIKALKHVSSKDTPLSRGLTQIKYNQDVDDPELSDFYAKYGITDKGLKIDPRQMARATIGRSLVGENTLGEQDYRYSDNTVIPKDTALAIWWNRGKLTDGINPNPKTDTSSVSGYSRRFENNKVIK